LKFWENAFLRDADHRRIERELKGLMNRMMIPVQRRQILRLGEWKVEVELRWTCDEEEYYDTVHKKICTAFAVSRRD